MPVKRTSAAKSLLLGFLFATLFTLAAMLLLALILVFTQISDKHITLINQCIKIMAVILGVRAAVPRGAQRGFATGLLVSLVYITAGYVLYATLGGAIFSVPSMLGEMLLSSAVGAVTGAIRANLYPKRRSAALSTRNK